MRPLTIVSTYQKGHLFGKSRRGIKESDLVEDLIAVDAPLTANETLSILFTEVKTDYFLLLLRDTIASFESYALAKMLEMAKTSRAGIVYCDYYDEERGSKKPHPLID